MAAPKELSFIILYISLQQQIINTMKRIIFDIFKKAGCDELKFSSLNQLIETISKDINWSKGKVKSQITTLIQEKYISFENNLLRKGIFIEFTPRPATPDYIYQTKEIGNLKCQLNEKSWWILDFLYSQEHSLSVVFENNEVDFEKSLYVSTETIAKGVELSQGQVVREMNRLCYYLGDNFWRKPSEKERSKRKYKNSLSYTINLPKRKDLKTIILNVLKAKTGKDLWKRVKVNWKNFISKSKEKIEEAKSKFRKFQDEVLDNLYHWFEVKTISKIKFEEYEKEINRAGVGENWSLLLQIQDKIRLCL